MTPEQTALVKSEIDQLRQLETDVNQPAEWLDHRRRLADALTAALTAGPALPAETAWQEIATAPLDLDVLLFTPRSGVVRGRWDDDRHARRPKPFWTNDQVQLWGRADTRADQPTHWAPLNALGVPPPPPAARATEDGDSRG